MAYQRSAEGEARRLAALRSPMARQRMSDAKKGVTPANYRQAREKAWNATRKDVLTYSGIHAWVRRNWGNPTECERCGASALTGRKVHWANKDHRYSRNRQDWMRVCRPCHAEHDQRVNGVTFTRFGSR